jgi:hypothetical protein
MQKIVRLIALSSFLVTQTLVAQTVTINVDVNKGKKPISPYIYGRNNGLSDAPGSPTTAATWKQFRDAGVHYARENGGNNASKYNWRKKLSSHPDWYNNIYNHDWDYQAKTLTDSLPGTQGMWAFQLLGHSASNLNNNFNDWAYNGSAWWAGTCQNLAGGGVANGAGGCAATTNGNINLYTENWTSDSTVGMLDHWFGTGGLGLNKNVIQYWSMDNEPDIWNGTHDDVMPTQPTAEAFMQLYFTVAKKARAKYPAIKLCGPVPASEWQWYSWNNNKITAANGLSYTWLEFFIKRVSEEETASGIRLLDVLDIHSYPQVSQDSDIVQSHRIYFDTIYSSPDANGVKTTAASGWDNSITNEKVFVRCNQWLTQYLGSNHGVVLGVSEYGTKATSANVIANSYSSMLGTFADNGINFFSPWDWYPGYWEALHLFSRYAKSTRVLSTSSDEHFVTGYSSVNATGDSLTVILVNRALTASHTTNLNLSNFIVANGTYNTLQISSLPVTTPTPTETFISHTSNALHHGTVTSASNSISITLPALSTTAILIKGTTVTGIYESADRLLKANLYPNPVNGEHFYVDLSRETVSELKVELFNTLGKLVYSQLTSGKNAATLEVPCANLPKGVYTIRLSSAEGRSWTTRVVKM